jgi:hypothetical protein
MTPVLARVTVFAVFERAPPGHGTWRIAGLYAIEPRPGFVCGMRA